jgi:chromosome segregation ATPase
MKISSLLNEDRETNTGTVRGLPVDKDLIYRARNKYPGYDSQQALTLYIADQMSTQEKTDSTQNKLIDTQKRENERLRGAVDDLGQELQDFERQSIETDREVARLKQLSGKLSQGGTDTQRKAKVSGDDLEKLQKELEQLKNKPGIDYEKVKQLEDQIKQIASNPSFDNNELNRVEQIIKSFNTKQVVSDNLYQKAFTELQQTQEKLNAKEERFKKYISTKGQEVKTSSEEMKKYSKIIQGYKSEIDNFGKELSKMQKEKDIIYDLRAGVQQDAEDINSMKIDISQSLDFINQYMDKMTNAEPNKNVADINWLVGNNQKQQKANPANVPANVPSNVQESITEDYEVAPSRRYSNPNYNEWIHKHFSGLFSLFTRKFNKELINKGYSDRQIADTLEEYVPLLYNLGDDKTPPTPQQVQLWIDNVKLKLWERPVQHELFNESLDKTYARMLDKIIGLPYI